jgi:tRNA threonylcarbamoyladenosine biosynthesis protein TsaE
MRILDLAREADTLALGRALGRTLARGMVVHLSGELGAGKTTLARGILRALGYEGRVKSPTFTLLEVYKLSSLNLYHFDFYRFDQPDALADAGFREFFTPDALCLIEWPEKACGLPVPDLTITLSVKGEGRSAVLEAHTEAGRHCLERLEW